MHLFFKILLLYPLVSFVPKHPSVYPPAVIRSPPDSLFPRMGTRRENRRDQATGIFWQRFLAFNWASLLAPFRGKSSRESSVGEGMIRRRSATRKNGQGGCNEDLTVTQLQEERGGVKSLEK